MIKVFFYGLVSGSVLTWLFLILDDISKFSDIILALSALVSFYYTTRTFRLTQLSHEDNTRPSVATSLLQHDDYMNLVDMVISNFGRSAALNVKFKPSYNLKLYSDIKHINDVAIIKNGVPVLLPNQVIKFPLVILVGRYEELQQHPLFIEVEYESSIGKKYKENFKLDFSALVESQIGARPEHLIAKDIEKIAISLQHIERKIK